MDESGSFVHDKAVGKWNVVAALSAAESARKGISDAMAELRSCANAPPNTEIKMHQVSEPQYLQFLERLAGLNVMLSFVATDSGLSSIVNIQSHQQTQADKVLMRVEKMRYDEGKQALRTLASEIKSLSPQLYMQLVCQIQLMYDVVSSSTLFFVQRKPATLGKFRWRIDRKGEFKNDFERAFEKLSPALLQTMSMREPMIYVRDFDYSHMRRFEFAPGEEPTYLKRDYGLKVGSCLDIGKLLREDRQFVDSRSLDGVQAVDLLASGLRRCLRGRFGDNLQVAAKIGRLTVQASGERLPFRLVLVGEEADLDEPTRRVVRTIARNRQAMLVK
ncbi:DUF3800 domain-containing protein [Variovorax sp. RT4R15]|uniref:DUF3800 domain-containing protein n=1 Tax=Variovorax sp. RT4R15 TaxID=3443737 RepID=UPI003F4860B7